MAHSLALKRFLMVATLPLLFILQLTANYESFTVQSPNNNVSAGLEATKWLDCTLVQILSSADIDQNILEEKISEIEFLEAASSFHTNENQVHLYSKDAEKTHFSDPFLTIGHQRLYDLYCAWKLDC